MDAETRGSGLSRGNHLPLHPQAGIYTRGGIDLDRSMQADWVGQSAHLLHSLVQEVGAHVSAAERIHADDTTVPALAPPPKAG